jgi:CHRD domain-containing protein
VKGRRLFAAVILAVLAGVLLAIPAVAQTSTASSTALAGPTVVHAQMTGEQEVPGPGDPNGFGTATIALFPSSGKICYTLTAFRIAPANAAHIHEGSAGVAGPVVVGLRPPTFGVSGGCTSADPELVGEIAANPSQYYVNVHNQPFPDGAIRGQLHY